MILTYDVVVWCCVPISPLPNSGWINPCRYTSGSTPTNNTNESLLGSG